MRDSIVCVLSLHSPYHNPDAALHILIVRVQWFLYTLHARKKTCAAWIGVMHTAADQFDLGRERLRAKRVCYCVCADAAGRIYIERAQMCARCCAIGRPRFAEINTRAKHSTLASYQRFSSSTEIGGGKLRQIKCVRTQNRLCVWVSFLIVFVCVCVCVRKSDYVLPGITTWRYIHTYICIYLCFFLIRNSKKTTCDSLEAIARRFITSSSFWHHTTPSVVYAGSEFVYQHRADTMQNKTIASRAKRTSHKNAVPLTRAQKEFLRSVKLSCAYAWYTIWYVYTLADNCLAH